MRIYIVNHETAAEVYSGEHCAVHSSAQGREEGSEIRWIRVDNSGLVIGVSEPKLLMAESDGTLWIGKSVFSRSVVWSAGNEKEKGNEE